MKIFNKGLIIPPPLNFYLDFEDLQQGFDDDGDDDDDALPVVVEVPGKAQAFIDAVEFGKKGTILIQIIYIYIYTMWPPQL